MNIIINIISALIVCSILKDAWNYGDHTINWSKLDYLNRCIEEYKEQNKLFDFRRQALHAKKLTLNHPDSGKLISFKAELPKDMKELVKVLGEFDLS